MYKGLRAKLGLEEDVNTKRLADVIGLDCLLAEIFPLKDRKVVVVFRYENKIINPNLIGCEFKKGILSKVELNHIWFENSSPAFDPKWAYDFILTQDISRKKHPTTHAYTFDDRYIGTITVLHNDAVSAYASIEGKLPNPHALESIKEISNGMRFETSHLSWDHLDEGD